MKAEYPEHRMYSRFMEILKGLFSRISRSGKAYD